MVSKASELLPDPDSPVMTVNVFRGISTSIFFKLCCRAPCTVIRSSISGAGRMEVKLYFPTDARISGWRGRPGGGPGCRAAHRRAAAMPVGIATGADRKSRGGHYYPRLERNGWRRKRRASKILTHRILDCGRLYGEDFFRRH